MQDPSEFIRQVMPLCATLGISADRIGPEGVELRMAWAPELCTAGGVLHGGALMALADAAAATCAYLNLPAGTEATSTIEAKTNFLGSVRGGEVTARAIPLHVGRSTIVIETEARDEGGRLVAKTIQTQAILAGS